MLQVERLRLEQLRGRSDDVIDAEERQGEEVDQESHSPDTEVQRQEETVAAADADVAENDDGQPRRVRLSFEFWLTPPLLLNLPFGRYSLIVVPCKKY